MITESEKQLAKKAARREAITAEVTNIETAWELTGSKDEASLAARRWLLLEAAWYDRGHFFSDWPQQKAKMQAEERQAEKERATHAAEYEKEKRAADAQIKERDDRLRAELEEAADPVAIHKRSKAARIW